MTHREQSVFENIANRFSPFARCAGFLTGCASTVIAILGCALSVSAQEIPAQEQAVEKGSDASEAKVQMDAMRAIAKGVKMTVTDGNTSREVELIPDALFRSNDPARNWYHGSTWGFGRKGRPVALLSLALYRTNTGNPSGWLHEFNSLSSASIESKTAEGRAWSTRKAGLEFKDIPGAAAVADKETGRTRQFREMSARFSGFESLQEGVNAKPERIELRLIPHPVYRYSDPEQGLVDGAIFFMVHSTNPEAVLVLEAVHDGVSDPVWKFAFTRLTFAELHVDLDGKEVWTLPSINSTPPTEPYLVFFQPVTPGERTNK